MEVAQRTLDRIGVVEIHEAPHSAGSSAAGDVLPRRVDDAHRDGGFCRHAAARKEMRADRTQRDHDVDAGIFLGGRQKPGQGRGSAVSGERRQELELARPEEPLNLLPGRLDQRIEAGTGLVEDQRYPRRRGLRAQWHGEGPGYGSDDQTPRGRAHHWRA